MSSFLDLFWMFSGVSHLCNVWNVLWAIVSPRKNWETSFHTLGFSRYLISLGSLQMYQESEVTVCSYCTVEREEEGVRSRQLHYPFKPQDGAPIIQTLACISRSPPHPPACFAHPAWFFLLCNLFVFVSASAFSLKFLFSVSISLLSSFFPFYLDLYLLPGQSTI